MNCMSLFSYPPSNILTLLGSVLAATSFSTSPPAWVSGGGLLTFSTAFVFWDNSSCTSKQFGVNPAVYLHI